MHPMRSTALITCKALAHVLAPLVGPDTRVVQLDIGLHLNPKRLSARLLNEIALLERPGLDIVLGYGLCGRGTEGVISRKSRLVLPRVDDCVGALLGSRARHQEIVKTFPGCYFLEPAWLSNELNIFEEVKKGLERIPPHRHDKIIEIALSHYRTLALLSEKANPSSPAWSRCERYGKAHRLKFIHLVTDHSLLHRLVGGRWTSPDFLVMEPGEPVPLF